MFGLKQMFNSEPEGDYQFIIARLNARVQPIDRGEYFEDPLDEVIKELNLGQVTGGGTQLAGDPDGIEFCDVEIRCEEISDLTIAKIIETLEKLGAPKGSRLLLENPDREITFGKLEGLGLFINGTDLPDEVYANSDVNDVIEALERSIEGIGNFRGHWEGSSETALYFYGETFSKMQEAMADTINNTPLCGMSRTVQIA